MVCRLVTMKEWEILLSAAVHQLEVQRKVLDVPTTMVYVQIGKEILFKVIWFRHLECWYLFVVWLVCVVRGPTLCWNASKAEAPMSVGRRCLRMSERPSD
jgi:hypothetical protein